MSALVNALNRLWVIGRRSERHYVRFYPNPGFLITVGNRRFRWSKFYGLKVERVKKLDRR